MGIENSTAVCKRSGMSQLTETLLQSYTFYPPPAQLNSNPHWSTRLPAAKPNVNKNLSDSQHEIIVNDLEPMGHTSVQKKPVLVGSGPISHRTDTKTTLLAYNRSFLYCEFELAHNSANVFFVFVSFACLLAPLDKQVWMFS